MKVDFTSSKIYWLLLKVSLVLSMVVLLVSPVIWINKIKTFRDISIYGYHILLSTSGLESLLQPLNLNPQPFIITAIVLLVIALALTFKKKPGFLPILFVIFSVAFVWLAAQHYSWIVKCTSSMQWGFVLFGVLSIISILLTFAAAGLSRLKFHSGEFGSHVELITMLLPGSILLIIFSYLPLPGILLAFKNYKLHGTSVFESFFKSAWVGLNNLSFIFRTPDAFNMTKNTVLYNLTFIILGLITSVTIAILISEISNRRTAKVYQTLYFLPYFLSWVVVSYLVYALLNYEYGVLNNILRSLGLAPIEWYMEQRYWPFIFVIANLWKYAGNGSIIYMATITGMDPALFEAASIDGATKFQQIKYITLPLLKTTMILLTILAVGRIFSADFGLFYLLTRNVGPLRSVSTVIDTYVYSSLNSGTINLGMTSAVALYQSVVGFILILSANAIVKKIDPDSSLL